MTTTLAQFGAAAVPALVDALGQDDPAVRAHAADVLTYIGSPAATEAIGPLVDRLGDELPDVRLAAVLALRELAAHPVAKDALRHAPGTHDDARVRAVASAPL